MKTTDGDKVSKILQKLVSAPGSHQGKPLGLKFPQTFKFVKHVIVMPENLSSLCGILLSC